MLSPNAFSTLSAISGDSEALPFRRSDSVARRTPRIRAAAETLNPNSSRASMRMKAPGWGGARPRFAHSGRRLPLEAVDDPVVHPAAPDGHDPVRAVDRPAAAACLQPVDDDGPAATLDDSAAAGHATPAGFVVAHPVEVWAAVAHELRDCGVTPAIRCAFLAGQDRVSSPDQVLEPVARGLPPRAVRHHLFQGVLKPLEHREDVAHAGRPHAREDLSHRTLDPLRPVGQDHDLFAVESAAPHRRPPAGPPGPRVLPRVAEPPCRRPRRPAAQVPPPPRARPSARTRRLGHRATSPHGRSGNG